MEASLDLRSSKPAWARDRDRERERERERERVAAMQNIKTTYMLGSSI
jgi:hypothetical protein